MARAVEGHWPAPLSGLVVVPYGHAVPCRHVSVVEAAPPRARRGRSARGERHRRRGQRPHRRRPRPLPDLRRRVVAAQPARARHRARRRARDRRGAAAQRRADLRRQLRAQAPVGDQGWPPGGGRLAGACGRPDGLGRTRRRSVRDRLGTDGRRPDHVHGRARGARPVRGDRPRARAPSPARRRARRPRCSQRDSQARRSRSCRAPAPPSSSPRPTLWPRPPRRPRRAACAPSCSATRSRARRATSACATPATRSTWCAGASRATASVLLSGGETTVTVRGAGRGGRNTEYLLGLALGLEGCPDVFALAADTDGRDGSEGNAGAFLTPDTLARARAAGLDPRGLARRQRRLRPVRPPRRPARHRAHPDQRQRPAGHPPRAVTRCDAGAAVPTPQAARTAAHRARCE